VYFNYRKYAEIVIQLHNTNLFRRYHNTEYKIHEMHFKFNYLYFSKLLYNTVINKTCDISYVTHTWSSRASSITFWSWIRWRTDSTIKAFDSCHRETL